MVELEEYKMLLSERPSMKKADFISRLVSDTPFDTEAELDSWIKKTEADIKRKEKKDLGEEAEPEEDPVFPMVDRPDAELNEEEIREKRRQRLMKAGWEARIRAREEKRKEKDRLDEVKRLEEEFRVTDPTGWSAKMRSEQEVRVDHRKPPRLRADLSGCHCSYTGAKEKKGSARR
jgi:actin-related protein 5